MVRKEHTAPYGMQLDSGFDGTDLWKSSFPDVSVPYLHHEGIWNQIPNSSGGGEAESSCGNDSIHCASRQHKAVCAHKHQSNSCTGSPETLPSPNAVQRGEVQRALQCGRGIPAHIAPPWRQLQLSTESSTAGKCAAPAREDCRVQRKHQEQKCGDAEMKGRAQFQCNLYSQRQKGAGWGWYNSLSTNSLKQRRTELGPFLQHSQLPLSRSRGWCWESSHSWGPTTESLQHHLRTRWFSEGRTLLRLLPKPSLGFPPPLIYQKYINRKDCSPPT